MERIDTHEIVKELIEGTLPQKAAETIGKVLLKVSSPNGSYVTKEQISHLEQEQGEIKTDIVTMKNDISTLKQDVTILKQDVTTLKQDVTILKQDVTILKQDVEFIKGTMATKNDLKIAVGGLERDMKWLMGIGIAIIGLLINIMMKG
jgi:uncharacterized protein (UPF0335 family)